MTRLSPCSPSLCLYAPLLCCTHCCAALPRCVLFACPHAVPPPTCTVLTPVHAPCCTPTRMYCSHSCAHPCCTPIRMYCSHSCAPPCCTPIRMYCSHCCARPLPLHSLLCCTAAVLLSSEFCFSFLRTTLKPRDNSAELRGERRGRSLKCTQLHDPQIA